MLDFLFYTKQSKKPHAHTQKHKKKKLNHLPDKIFDFALFGARFVCFAAAVFRGFRPRFFGISTLSIFTQITEFIQKVKKYKYKKKKEK